MYRLASFNVLGAVILCLGISMPARAESYVTFTIPNGAIESVTGINSNGDVTGSAQISLNNTYQTVAYVYTRATNTVTTFAVPVGGAGSNSNAITDNGTTVGYYGDTANLVTEGFIRMPDGSLATYIAPFNKSNLENYSTTLTGINNQGDLGLFAVSCGMRRSHLQAACAAANG